MADMKAVGVVHENRGSVDKFVSKLIPKPGPPQERDILLRIKAASVNPIDIKVRAGRYDDAPDYYDRCPKPFQVCGYDIAGIVEAVGSSVTRFRPGDEVFGLCSPIRNGSNAEYALVHEGALTAKPRTLDFVQAASMPLAYMTAYESLVDRMEIKKGEKAALLIINGAGGKMIHCETPRSLFGVRDKFAHIVGSVIGVGSMASQIAREVLDLPVVISTASRPETQDFCRAMGATHVINHREDLQAQIDDLKLDVPLKYIYITYNTDMYIETCGKICAPFGKVCSIVQGQARMYGTEFMAKSMAFIWCYLGTKLYYGVDTESYAKILSELADMVDEGKVKCTLKQTMKLDLNGLRKAHEAIEAGGTIGKIGLEVPEDETAFA